MRMCAFVVPGRRALDCYTPLRFGARRDPRRSARPGGRMDHRIHHWGRRVATHVQSAGRTEVGKVRRRNEDAILVRDAAGLWAVADGLGGHAEGDRASSLVVARLARVPRADDTLAFIDAIDDALDDANRDLRRAALARGVDLIASTVALLVSDARCVLCAWAGDSRVYRYADGTLAQLTGDHVYRIDPGVEPAAGGAALTRAVGADESLCVAWGVVPCDAEASFVLCSDGLNKELRDAEIAAACARHAAPAALLDELFRMALGRAARDNVSAVAVRAPRAMPAAAGWRDANAALQALDAARAAGRLDGAGYRAERRRLLGRLLGGTPATVRSGWWASLWQRWRRS